MGIMHFSFQSSHYVIPFQVKYQGRRKKKSRRDVDPVMTINFPTRPALWLDFKKRKGTCSSRRTSIHDIVSSIINSFFLKM